MAKAILISIRPKWCKLIASGKKTVDVRKTEPKIETPFKCYIYCTKDYSLGELYLSEDDFASSSQGMVVGEFVCGGIAQYRFTKEDTDIEDYEDVQLSCLTAEEIQKYGNNKTLYFWIISDLVIYDKPKELSEFRHCGTNYHYNPPITRPPQSWCYVEKGESDGT